MNDQRFHDLAMKALARQATEAERAELDALVAGSPELKAEFERLRGDVRMAKELLPVAAATEASAGEFPPYARERLQTKVRQTLGSHRAEEAERVRGWSRSLWLGLATLTVVILTLTIPFLLRPTVPIIQVAMLDTAGQTRGGDTNEVSLLHAAWKESPVNTFSKANELEGWEKDWPASSARPVVKVIFDRSAGEIRVVGRSKGKAFQKSFPTGNGLEAALRDAKGFVAEQTGFDLR